MPDTTDLSGLWSGEFSYPRHEGPVTPFLAMLEERSGRLTGTIIEPDIVCGGPSAQATIVGLRQGSSVDFTKPYGPIPLFGYDNPVDYVGIVSPDGNTVSGMWSLLEFDGRFEMRREETPGALVADERRASMDVR